MNSALTRAQPEAAIALYEKLEKKLKAEELEPAIEVVKLFHRAKLGI